MSIASERSHYPGDPNGNAGLVGSGSAMGSAAVAGAAAAGVAPVGAPASGSSPAGAAPAGTAAGGAAAAPAPPEFVSLLRDSWAAVEQVGERAASYFYAVLFTLDPSLREMFPEAMGGQRHRLLAALGHIVSHVDDSATLATFVEQLGRDHRRFDVRPEHYPLVGQALLHTLAHHLGPAWTPALENAWAAAYEQVSRIMIDSAARSLGEPARWDGEIVSHERRTGDIAVIRVRLTEPYRWRAGQSAAVESHLRPRVWRYLSPANAPRDDGVVEFHVRAVPGGELSPALVYQAQVGDVLRISAPIGTGLTLPSGPGPDLLLLAGGTGLAPLRALLEQLLYANDQRAVTMIIGAHWQHELYDLPTLRELAQRMPRLTLYAALSEDPSLGEPRSVAAAALGAGNWQDRLIYICGSPSMVHATRQMFTDRGYAPEQLRIEPYDGTTYAPLQDISRAGERA